MGGPRQPVTRHQRPPGRLLAVAVGLAVVGGCESHQVTRPVDPPMTAATWAVVWIAGLLCVAGTTVHLVRFVAAGRRPSIERAVLGGALLATTATVAGAVVFQIAADRRTDQILGDHGCRSLAAERRPEQIVQLTCSDGGLDGLGWILVLLFVVPAGLLLAASAITALRGEARPILPTALACAGAVAAALTIVPAVDDGGLAAASLVAATALYAVAAWCGVREVRRGPSGPGGPGAAVGAAPTSTAATPAPAEPSTGAGAVRAVPVDRMQAALIDGLIALVAGGFLVGLLPGSSRPAALVVAAAAYLVVATALWGRTIGKLVLRLQVRSLAGSGPPGPGAALIRAGVLVAGPVAAGFLTGSLGTTVLALAVVLAPMARPDRRGLHDHAAGTEVVRRLG